MVQPNVPAVLRHDRAAGAGAQGLRQAIGKAFAVERSDEGMLEENVVEGSALRDLAHDDGTRGGADNPVFVYRPAFGFTHSPYAAQAVLVNDFLEVELRSRVVTHTADVSGALQADLLS